MKILQYKLYEKYIFFTFIVKLEYNDIKVFSCIIIKIVNYSTILLLVNSLIITYFFAHQNIWIIIKNIPLKYNIIE